MDGDIKGCLTSFPRPSQVDDFLQALVNFDKEHIPEATVRCVRDEYLRDPDFNPDFVRLKSSAAAGLCSWVINIVRFHEALPRRTRAHARARTHARTHARTNQNIHVQSSCYMTAFGTNSTVLMLIISLFFHRGLRQMYVSEKISNICTAQYTVIH